MIVIGKHLPRRTFLKGLGAAVALPMLDAMTPAFAAPALKQTPTRLAFTYIPNGVTLEAWTPAAGGRDFAFTRILKPLEDCASTRWSSPAWRSRTRTPWPTAPAITRAPRRAT